MRKWLLVIVTMTANVSGWSAFASDTALPGAEDIKSPVKQKQKLYNANGILADSPDLNITFPLTEDLMPAKPKTGIVTRQLETYFLKNKADEVRARVNCVIDFYVVAKPYGKDFDHKIAKGSFSGPTPFSMPKESGQRYDFTAAFKGDVKGVPRESLVTCKITELDPYHKTDPVKQIEFVKILRLLGFANFSKEPSPEG